MAFALSRRIRMSKPLPLLRHFRKLKDPRINRRKLHSLEAILVIAICAVIAGANDFQQIALFAQKRKDWLGRFLELPNGVPSHDTFERVFARLDPLRFQECFATWMNAWYAQLTGKHLQGNRIKAHPIFPTSRTFSR
jgi:DDE_Tnp_1-associated